MIFLKALLYLKLCFAITLVFAVTVGDIFTIWYDNNMLEEYVVIVFLGTITFTVIKVKQLLKNKK